MLTHTFSHIPGIGQKTEQRFWSAGIHAWDDFKAPYPIKLPAGKIDIISNHLEQSKNNLTDNPIYFTELLRANQHWRLFPHYRQSTAYLDIETTGLGDDGDYITTIAIYDGTNIFYYVNGDNLDNFVSDINKYDVLVTYNGKCFDIPFIENFFGCKIDKAHIDLRYILRSLGYSGGLKSCEKQLGLDRGDLDGVDGCFAVLLWQEYKKSGNKKALETLLAYNIEDVVNLEILMVEAYNLNLEKTPFYDSHRLSYPASPNVPFTAELKVIDKIKRAYWI